jgi:hypothetical protein
MEDDSEVGLLSDKSHPGFSHNENTDTFTSSKNGRILRKAAILSITLVVLYCSYSMLFRSMLVVAGLGAGAGQAAGSQPSGGVSAGSSKFSQYFDPNPEIYPGPTATGRAPFMAQETMAPTGERNNRTIQQMFGHLSPYSPNIIGFGVEEQPLPPGANITQVHVRHRACLLQL